MLVNVNLKGKSEKIDVNIKSQYSRELNCFLCDWMIKHNKSTVLVYKVCGSIHIFFEDVPAV